MLFDIYWNGSNILYGLWLNKFGVKAETLHDRITDDKFCISFDMSGADEELKVQFVHFFKNMAPLWWTLN